MNRSLVLIVLWLIETVSDKPDLVVSVNSIIFYHFPFYILGVFNIIIDKGCINCLTNAFHPRSPENSTYHSKFHGTALT